MISQLLVLSPCAVSEGDYYCVSTSPSLPIDTDRDMAGRHQARTSSIQIRQVAVVPANKCRRPHIKQMHVSLFRKKKLNINVTTLFCLEIQHQVPTASPCHAQPLPFQVCGEEAQHNLLDRVYAVTVHTYCAMCDRRDFICFHKFLNTSMVLADIALSVEDMVTC